MDGGTWKSRRDAGGPGGRRRPSVVCRPSSVVHRRSALAVPVVAHGDEELRLSTLARVPSSSKLARGEGAGTDYRAVIRSLPCRRASGCSGDVFAARNGEEGQQRRRTGPVRTYTIGMGRVAPFRVALKKSTARHSSATILSTIRKMEMNVTLTFLPVLWVVF